LKKDKIVTVVVTGSDYNGADIRTRKIDRIIPKYAIEITKLA